MKNIFHDQSSDTYHVSEILLVYLVKLPNIQLLENEIHLF
jgi:hypothetical protein